MSDHSHAFMSQRANLLDEADLLGPALSDNEDYRPINEHDHAVVTAPVITGDALNTLGPHSFPQTALYGRVISQHGEGLSRKSADGRIFVNTNAPFSALVCGVQGSGKSHTTSVLLESVLIQDDRLGRLPKPLSAIVFHLDSAAGGGMVQPCEAAYLASVDQARGANIQAPSVTVLVLPNNLRSMRRVYAGLPTVRVEPLHFASGDISGERLLSMMKVDENAQMPLYMEAIMNILRQMEDRFDYSAFRQKLQAQQFNPGQKAMLNLRLSLLDACLAGGTESNSMTTHFREGQLTIIDLSSPFMDGSSACGFFDMILGLFVEADIGGAGKLVVLDEAHKYLSDKGTSSRLTDSLLTVIRQQRHLATRVVISTQEPTVVPEKFLDLCSFVIAHRFSSPTWLKHLTKHMSTSETSFDDLWTKVLSLGTGYAVLFAPNALCVKTSATEGPDNDEPDKTTNATPGLLGQGYLIVRSRQRVTLDGGHSLLAVQDDHHATRLGRVSAVVPPSALATETSSPLRIEHAVPAIETSGPQLAGNFGADIEAQGHTMEVMSAATSRTSVPSPPLKVSGSEAQAVRTFVQSLTAHSQAGVPWVAWDTFRHEMTAIQPPAAQPYRTKNSLLAVVSHAHFQGILQLRAEKGQHWVALPGVPWTPDGSTSAPSVSQQRDVPRASLSEPATARIPLRPILRAIGDAHKLGYPLVGFTYVAHKAAMWWIKGIKNPFEQAFAEAVSTGQVLIADVNDDEMKGQWVYLPEGSVHRGPMRSQVRKIPTPGDPNEFDPLMAYLLPGKQIFRRTVDVYFKTEVPDTPYGQTGSQINKALKRAEERGLIICGGSRRKEAWVQRKD